MSLVFSVPGKTFLAGEYLALSGGPTLVFASEPRFELTVENGTGKHEEIHADSPAGLFIRKHQDYFKAFDLKFNDPYQGKGGFGASTAQFLSVYAMNAWRESVHHEPQQLLDYKHLLESYYEVAWNGQGTRPSGADLIGQLKGNLTLFEKSAGKISIMPWPFGDLDFALVHTGNKVATHEHLKSLGEFSTSSLEKAFAEIRHGLENHASDEVISGVNNYSQALQALGFTCAETLVLLQETRQVPGVKAVKGCGALGADVILVVFDKNHRSDLEKYLNTKNLSITASRSQMSAGLNVRAVRSSL
ncbi:hypothetical protein D3C87_163540 [compost metagenome]